MTTLPLQKKKTDTKQSQPSPIKTPIDVAILTFNSEHKLRECIDSVYRNIPVSNLIVVDGFSEDNTEAIIVEYQKKYGNVIFIQEKGTRGSARQTAIGLVKTDWFVFVDSDVILSNNWFAKAEKLVNNDVGGVWGIEIWSVLKDNKILSLFERVTLKIFEQRGGTHDLLVRTKTVKDINIPFELHTYEDGYIKDWIESKSYKVLGVYEPCCIHYRPETVWTMRKHIEFVVSDLKYAIHRPILLPSYGFYSVIVGFQIFAGKNGKQNKKRING